MIQFSSRVLRRDATHSIARKRSVQHITNLHKALLRTVRHSTAKDWRRYLKRSVIGFAALMLIYVGYLWITLPNISDPNSFLAAQSTSIVDKNGEELYRVFSEENRTFINNSLIPEHMKQAIIAIEDERFYDRGCLDVIALGRAVLYMGRAGGASTLTRQLARNALSLRGENVVNRKLKELALGCLIESRYTKDEVLGLYLNWVPFGQNAYGIEQASKTYFAKSAQEITIAESAVLASLPQRPTYFNPYGKNVRTRVSDEILAKIESGDISSVEQLPDEGVYIGLIGNTFGSGANVLYIGGRSNQVLKNMEDQGYITATEREQAVTELGQLQFTQQREAIRAAHFVLWIRDQVEELLQKQNEADYLERGGLTVHTTLDWNIQQIAEDVIAKNRDGLLERFGAHNASLLSVDPNTGEILAYVGNMDYSDTDHGGKIDMIQVPRQPGSSFKPLVYLSAFSKGYSPATVLFDVQTKIGDDTPQNYDGDFMGPMSIRSALAGSRNIPAAKAYFMAGSEKEILEQVKKMGAPTPLDVFTKNTQENPEFKYGWPLALGAAETPMYEMVQLYSTLALKGSHLPLVAITKITDKDGTVLYEHTVAEPEEVIDPRLAYQVTSILSDEEARPAGFWRTQLSVPGYQAAAKTGTSNKCLEWSSTGVCKLRKPDNGWVMGYTPNLVTGVWIGNADSSAMFDKADGLTSASPMWKEFMTRAHTELTDPITSFSQPSGMVEVEVSTLSGLLPAECTPLEKRKKELFLQENVPTETDTACTLVAVDKVTGLLASDTCPLEAQEQKPFFVVQSILADRWPTWQSAALSWATEEAKMWDPALPTPGSGSLLPLPPVPTLQCDPSLTPGRLQKPTVRIDAPLSTATYPAFSVNASVESVNAIREMRYEIDGKIALSETRPPFRGIIRVPKSVSQAGKHTLTVTVVDEFYNTATDTREFTFGTDTKNPEITIVSPVNQAAFAVNELITLRADATDAEGGIKYVQWYLDDTLLSTKPNSPYELEYVLAVEPGVYDVKAIAEDYAEHTSADKVRITVLPADGTSRLTSDTPTLLSPATETRISARETLPITAVLPAFTATTGERIVLEIGFNSTYETIFSLSQSNGGIMSKEWSPKNGGVYTLRLRTTYADGTEKIWDSREITVR
jgi:membrane peptidoglycan carboxypeptidase